MNKRHTSTYLIIVLAINNAYILVWNIFTYGHAGNGFFWRALLLSLLCLGAGLVAHLIPHMLGKSKRSLLNGTAYYAMYAAVVYMIFKIPLFFIAMFSA